MASLFIGNAVEIQQDCTREQLQCWSGPGHNHNSVDYAGIRFSVESLYKCLNASPSILMLLIQPPGIDEWPQGAWKSPKISIKRDQRQIIALFSHQIMYEYASLLLRVFYVSLVYDVYIKEGG